MKQKFKSAWQKALDFVSQGHSVWIEDSEVGEAALLPGSKPDFVQALYPNAPSHEASISKLTTLQRPDFSILQVFENADDVLAIIRSCTHWNVHRSDIHENRYRYTRQALPEVASGRSNNMLVYLTEDGFDVIVNTFLPLPALAYQHPAVKIDNPLRTPKETASATK